MKKTLAAFALVIATGSLAFAGDVPAGGRGGHRGHYRGARLAEKLNLTSEQKEQMKALRQRYREANQQLISDLHAKRREFAGLKKAGDPRAEEMKAQLKAMREQVQAAREATHQQVLGLLTAEQRQQLDQLRAERKQRRQ
jgi:Spy/CpxP family protein refolding chaperone